MNSKHLYLNTALSLQVAEPFLQLEEKVDLTRPVHACIAGELAVNIYTGDKLATSIDVSYSERMMIPENLASSIKGIDGRDSMLRFNIYYNQMFTVARMHAFRDAISVDFGLKMIQLTALTPVDLAISKVGRLSEVDPEDACSLARAGLVTATKC